MSLGCRQRLDGSCQFVRATFCKLGERPFNLTVSARDTFGNVNTTSIRVDDDGIESRIDRARSDVQLDESMVYSSEFNTGTTQGTLYRAAGIFQAKGLSGGGIRLELIEEAPA